jgi:hypothetical protein
VTILRDLFGPGTWGTAGNLVAWVICGAIGGTAAWFGRHKITARAAALWDRHHGPLAVKRHKQALREHEAEQRRGGEDGD